MHPCSKLSSPALSFLVSVALLCAPGAAQAGAADKPGAPTNATQAAALPNGALHPASLTPQRRLQEGLIVRLDPGYLVWKLDGPRIASQLGVVAAEVAPLLVQQTQNGAGLAFHLGYNIRGHVSLALALRGSGWDLGGQQRGGGGFLTFEAGWHPAALFEALELLSPTAKRWWDASVHFGAGYGLVGEDRALDGLVLSYGFRLEASPLDWLSLGLGLTVLPLHFSRYVVNWSGGVDRPLPEGSGGYALFPAISLGLHAPLGG